METIQPVAASASPPAQNAINQPASEANPAAFNPIPMLWPVYGFRAGFRDPVATCLDYGAAVDLVNGSERNLYIGEPRYARPPELDPATKGLWQ